MEAAVEQLTDHSSAEHVKLSEVGYETSIQEELNPQANGVAESDNVVQSELNVIDVNTGKLDANGHLSTVDIDTNDGLNIERSLDTTQSVAEKSASVVGVSDCIPEVATVADTECTKVASVDDEVMENQEHAGKTTDSQQNEASQSMISVIPDTPIKTLVLNEVEAEEVVVESQTESTGGDNVRFETEVVVETNDMDVTEVERSDIKTQGSPHNILSELNQNIELSEALQSSDVTDNVENNNCSIRQEMFNKEELLDILEGNDVECTELQIEGKLDEGLIKNAETKLALEQLNRLKKSRRQRSAEFKKRSVQTPTPKKKTKTKKVIIENNKEESIVNALVKDWEDDIEEGESLNEKDISSSEQTLESPANVIKNEKRSSVDSSTSDGHNSTFNKSADEGQPQRRLGRVIKKKVIFDPDNPDTFTKGKAHVKSRESQSDKDQPPPKKIKNEPMAQRPKSKSPVSKMNWKKPLSKNSKQQRRLTEVDKLLMDEGAVNMIYQLTPEAPKGKKNMRTKAEFIKKIQSSTPESKEMKFRERKRESKSEDGDPKKILSGKQRGSMSSSVKSPSACEDFETHSADDSIIYRRHSSSSYSSSCMSPRRLSDIEAGNIQSVNISQQSNDKSQLEGSNSLHEEEDPLLCTDIINKDDCLSIKKKLNSKLTLALNKRKRDNSKPEKPMKKQLKMNEEQFKDEKSNFKFLSLKFDQRFAEICIRNTLTKLSIEIIKEIIEALSYVDLRTDTSVTLLTSECGTLCSEIDLRPSLLNDPEERTKAANEIADSIRSLLWAVGQHSKLMCVAASGACSGVALALVALADVALASEGATFAVSHRSDAPPESGIAAVVTSYRQLPQALLNDLVIFGRRLSSTEALQGGLVSRVLCDAGFSAQLQAVVSDIASQPMEILLMKKKLLGLRKPSDDVFLSALETERALMVKYWTSREGQESIRATMQDL